MSVGEKSSGFLLTGIVCYFVRAFFLFLLVVNFFSSSSMAGVAPPPKPEELQPHPVKDQLPNVSYCITSPPPWREFTVSLTLFVFVL